MAKKGTKTNYLLPIALLGAAIGLPFILKAAKAADAGNKLEIDFEKASKLKFSNSRFTFDSYLRFKNPTNTPLKLKSLLLSIYVYDSTKIANIDLTEKQLNTIIPAMDVKVIKLPVQSLSIYELGAAILSNIKNGLPKSVRMSGTVTANDFTVPIDSTTTFS